VVAHERTGKSVAFSVPSVCRRRFRALGIDFVREGIFR